MLRYKDGTEVKEGDIFTLDTWLNETSSSRWVVSELKEDSCRHAMLNNPTYTLSVLRQFNFNYLRLIERRTKKERKSGFSKFIKDHGL